MSNLNALPKVVRVTLLIRTAYQITCVALSKLNLAQASIFQPYCLRLQRWFKYLHCCNRIELVANFVPGNFILFRRNPGCKTLAQVTESVRIL